MRSAVRTDIIRNVFAREVTIFNTKPLCVYRRDTSIRDILVHSTLLSHSDDTQATPAGTFFATDPGAAHATSQEGRKATVSNANGDVRLKGQFDCTAAGVVYVIAHKRCHKQYIGETSRRLSDRFGEHLRSVEGFKQKPRYQGGGFPWSNTSISLTTTKSMTCECLW